METIGNSKIDLNIELEVFHKIVSEIKDLSKESQQKILGMVFTFLEIELPKQQSQRPNYNYNINQQDETTKSSPTFSEDRSMSPKDFIFEKQPKTDLERVVCLAYYLTHYRDTPYFKTFDISKLNTEAAQIKFSNPAVAVDNATKIGYLVPATKGQKQLSTIGEIFVSSLPDREKAKEAIKNLRPKRKSKSGSKNKDKDQHQ